MMNGQPCVRGMRLTVGRVLEAIPIDADRVELFREFSEIEEEDVRQALSFAAASLNDSLLDVRTA